MTTWRQPVCRWYWHRQAGSKYTQSMSTIVEENTGSEDTLDGMSVAPLEDPTQDLPALGVEVSPASHCWLSMQLASMVPSGDTAWFPRSSISSESVGSSRSSDFVKVEDDLVSTDADDTDADSVESDEPVVSVAEPVEEPMDTFQDTGSVETIAEDEELKCKEVGSTSFLTGSTVSILSSIDSLSEFDSTSELTLDEIAYPYVPPSSSINKEAPWGQYFQPWKSYSPPPAVPEPTTYPSCSPFAPSPLPQMSLSHVPQAHSASYTPPIAHYAHLSGSYTPQVNQAVLHKLPHLPSYTPQPTYSYNTAHQSFTPQPVYYTTFAQPLHAQQPYFSTVAQQPAFYSSGSPQPVHWARQPVF